MEVLALYFHMCTLPLEDSTSHVDPSSTVFPFLGEAMISPATAVTHLFDIISSHWEEAVPSARLRCEAGLLELLSLVLGYQEQQTALALESARLELERHYKTDINVDTLAKIAGLSRYHFIRLFKDRYGKGVMDYKTELRLTEAKRLIEQSPTLEGIADQVGYKNETYFSSLFKRHSGLSPSLYQRNRKCRVAAYSWVNFSQLLALQVIPFAAPIDHYWTDYYRSKYKYEVQIPLSHQYEFNRETLRKAKPDYIIGIDTFIPQEEKIQLEQIAPCLFLPWNQDWRQHLLLLAQFLNKSDEATKWLARYDRKAATIRKQIHPTIREDKLAVVIIKEDKLQVWGRLAGTVLYDDLRIPVPDAVANTTWNLSIEPQELAGLGANRLLIHISDNAASRASWDRLTWHELGAVQKQHIHLAIDSAWFEAPWNEYSAYNHDRFLGDIPHLFKHSSI